MTNHLRSPGSAAPDPVGRLAAAHQARPPAHAPAPSRLEQVLLGLSWASPTSYQLAQDAITRLADTQSELAEFTAPGPGRAGAARAVGALHARIGFVLGYWTEALVALEPGEWNDEHAAGLDRDLREIASTGAVALNLITHRAATPSPDASSAIDPGRGPGPGGARHRGRGRRDAPGQSVPPAGIGAATRATLPAETARLVTQTAGFVLAVAVVSVVCFEAFDRHPGQTPALPRPAAAAHAASSPTPARSPVTTQASPSETGRPAASGEVSSLQIQLLGASAAQPRIEVVVYLDAASTAPVTVAISFRAQDAPGAVTTTRTVAGQTSYQIALPLQVAADCGQAVLVAASAGGLSASQSTSAGVCATSTNSTSDMNGSKG